MDAFAAIVARMRADPRDYATASGLAAAAGIAPALMRTLTRTHYHTTPEQLLMGARLRRARALLAEGAPLARLGDAVGSSDEARFHRAFARATGCTPAQYRALRARSGFEIVLPPRYCADAALRVQGRDATSPCERTDGMHIVKAFTAQGGRALLHVRLERRRACGSVECSGSFPAGLGYAAHALALRLLGLEAAPPALPRRLRDAPEGVLFGRRPGLRVALMGDAFEALCWAIVGQQVNLSFASSLRRRLIELCGARAPRGMRAHPDAAAVAALDPGALRRLQYSRRKAEYLVGAARAVASGALPLARLGDWPASRARDALLALPGIGPWTAEYVLMRGVGLADCVPVGDAGLVAALARFYALPQRPDAQRTLALMAPFAPERSLATEHFWQSWSDGEI